MSQNEQKADFKKSQICFIWRHSGTDGGEILPTRDQLAVCTVWCTSCHIYIALFIYFMTYLCHSLPYH